MNNYLKIFNLHTNYETYINSSDKLLPNVSYCETEDEVHYNPYVYDYSKDYLTFEALENGSFTMTLDAKLPTTCVESVSYSIDNGETWTTTNNIDGESVAIITPEISTGNKVLWKGTAIQYRSNPDTYSGSNVGNVNLISTGKFNISGNIMSLLYEDNFINNNTLPDLIVTGYESSNLSRIFSGVGCQVISAENLILPATTLTKYCYYEMFSGCNSLVTAPKLPATTLADSCYSSMFYGCTALTSAPELPATTLAERCYYNMFTSCTSLTSTPELPATTLANYCYSSMFYGCTGLVNVPTNLLPVTGNLPQGCYASMFKGCTYLVNAPNLPGLMYGMYCYSNMFEDCTSLTTPPTQLNGYSIYQGTGFANSCCKCMFKNCTSLTTSPYINVTMNQNSSFSQYSSPMNEMFYGCSSLTQIRIAANYWRGTPAKNWVAGVATNGTFIKSSSLSESTIGRGVDGIPEGWTVQTA